MFVSLVLNILPDPVNVLGDPGEDGGISAVYSPSPKGHDAEHHVGPGGGDVAPAGPHKQAAARVALAGIRLLVTGTDEPLVDGDGPVVVVWTVADLVRDNRQAHLLKNAAGHVEGLKITCCRNCTAVMLLAWNQLNKFSTLERVGKKSCLLSIVFSTSMVQICESFKY